MSKNVWYFVLPQDDKFHIRYIKSEQDFFPFILKYLSNEKDVIDLFNQNCDFRLVYDSASKIDANQLNEHVYYKKIASNETIITYDEFKKEADKLKSFCIFKNNQWYVLAQNIYKANQAKVLNYQYHLESIEDRILPLKFHISSKKFINMCPDFNLFYNKYKNQLKEFYIEYFINDSESTKQKNLWWNHYVLNDFNTKGESELFKKLRIEIEKEILEAQVSSNNNMTKNNFKI